MKRRVARLIRVDGTVTEEERAIEAMVIAVYEEARDYEERRVYADAFLRCGDNAYTRRLARHNGWHVVEEHQDEPRDAA